jgi:hypothetical protein
MRVGVIATVGLVMLGLSAVLAWTHFDQGSRQRAGEWTRMDAQVDEVRLASRAPLSGLVTLSWDDGRGARQAGVAWISREDFDAGRYKVGDRVAAWVHPGFPRPELSEVPPDHAPDQAFTSVAALVALVAGVGLIGFAVATGRFFAG